jgi:hypothetical protein
MSIDYSEKIPNNVDLASNKTLQRALEHWQPAYLDWWNEMGPDKTSSAEVYLRTAISVDPKGWAHFDYVKMPDYRWGIFLAPQEAGRKVPSASTRARPPGRKCRASTARPCAASSSRRATPSRPRSSSSATSA